MASTHILLAFLVTTAAFAFLPGPAMLYAAAQTRAGGRWSGLMAALGLHLGDICMSRQRRLGCRSFFMRCRCFIRRSSWAGRCI